MKKREVGAVAGWVVVHSATDTYTLYPPHKINKVGIQPAEEGEFTVHVFVDDTRREGGAFCQSFPSKEQALWWVADHLLPEKNLSIDGALKEDW